MDRYYLGKLVDDINTAASQLAEAALKPHLRTLCALDRRVVSGERHFKVLRYLLAVDHACPVQKLLRLRPAFENLCRRFSGPDFDCVCHFGHDAPVQPEGSDLTVLLHFYMLHAGRDDDWNRHLCAVLLDDPETQTSLLPPWTGFGEGLRRDQLEDEILSFCQHYLSGNFDSLIPIRDFEAAFWRVVNLACTYHGADDWDALVDLLPIRFRERLKPLPDNWNALREAERSFSQEAFVQCSRQSIRFCQQLMELEATP
ncbi:MAG: hypothetical protein QNK37_17410 [Acidobacteriota bacterium]|nr:hypothetical protein [Acidobacteriota bacterium]